MNPSIQNLAFRTGVAQVLVRLAGLLRDYVILQSIGLSPAANDYFFFSWMQLTLLGFVNVLSITLIPKFARSGLYFSSRTRLLFVVTLLISVGGGTMFSAVLSNKIATNAVGLVTSFGLTIVTTTLSSQLIATSRQVSAVLPGLANAAVFIPLAWVDRALISSYALISTNLMGLFIEGLILVLLVRTNSAPSRSDLMLTSVEVRQVGALVVGGFISLCWASSDIAFVRSLGPDSVTLYSLASKISLGFSSIMIPTITIVVLPVVSRRISSLQELRDSWTIFRRPLRRLFLGVTGTCTLIGLISPVFIRALLSGSSLGDENVSDLLQIQLILLVSAIPYILGTVLVRLLQAAGGYSQVTFFATISFVVNVILDLVLSQLFGLAGIAIATVGAYATSAFLYLGYIRRETKKT